jgi:hypothetical protein
MKKSLIALAIGALALSACASTNGPRYQEARGPGDSGYYETRIEQNRYRVQYRADDRDSQIAEDWVFRRAAELTLDNRYDWFQVIARSRDISDNAFQRYDATRYDDSRNYNDRPPYGDYGDSVAMIEIIMGENPPPRASSVYDARRILDQFRDNRRY